MCADAKRGNTKENEILPPAVGMAAALTVKNFNFAVHRFPREDPARLRCEAASYWPTQNIMAMTSKTARY